MDGCTHIYNPRIRIRNLWQKNLTLYLRWFSFFLPSRLVANDEIASDEIIFSLMAKSQAESGLHSDCTSTDMMHSMSGC